VFIVSDGFCHDVKSRSQVRSRGGRQAVTHYMYDWMRSEYVDNGCRHYRSIPVLLPHTHIAGVPNWLRNTNLYRWPKQYKELFKVFSNFGKQLT